MKSKLFCRGNCKHQNALMPVALPSVFMLLAAFIIGCDKEGPSSPTRADENQSQTRAQVQFVESTPFVGVFQLVAGNKMQVEQFNVYFNVGDKAWAVGLPVKSNASLDEIEKEVQGRYASFLDTLAALADRYADDDIRNDLALLRQVKPRIYDFSVARMIATASDSAFTALKIGSTKIAKISSLDRTLSLAKGQETIEGTNSSGLSAGSVYYGTSFFCLFGCNKSKYIKAEDSWVTLETFIIIPLPYSIQYPQASAEFKGPAGAKVKVRHYLPFPYEPPHTQLDGKRTVTVDIMRWPGRAKLEVKVLKDARVKYRLVSFLP